ncbi:MAG: NAD-dependent epimerase/dehydratase family protein [Chitinophagaceae bacterium]|nr:NAD-dependent epimerase/dehydratase family protein [Chitinophagaceae bacterium]
MSAKTAALLGATGMIGSYLLEQLLNDPWFDTIRVIVRRPFANSHPKIEVKLVDFNDYESLKLAIDGSDVLFCAIGTTQKKVKGDKELYRKVDFDIPVKAEKICEETGCKKFVIVSSVGANSQSGNFYLKLKGELESVLEQMGLEGMESVHIMQPSMLLGNRKEKRPGEKIVQGAMRFISFILAGSLRKYKPIHGKVVAAAMLNAAKTDKKGVFRYGYDEIMAMTS